MLACLPRPVIPRTLANLSSRLPPLPVRHMVPPVSRGHGWDYRCKRLLLLVFAISWNRLSVSSPFRRDTLSFGPLNAIICARTTGPKPGARVPERCWSGRTGATGNRVGGESSLVGSNPILSASPRPVPFEAKFPYARMAAHGRPQVLGCIQQNTRHRQGPLRRSGSLLWDS